MRVVIAPDSFKSSLDAVSVAEAIAAGWRRERPSDQLVLVPFADGGEGTIAAIERSRGDAERVTIAVEGPDGDIVSAGYVRYREGDELVAIVELASTSGIERLRGELRPWTAGTRGFGQAMRAALAAGATRLIVAIGSSASTDGGVGMLQALGAGVFDGAGEPVASGAAGLEAVARVDLSPLVPLPVGGVTVLSDVTNPLLGPTGAAAIYGPQKGIDDVGRAERALKRWAGVVGERADACAPGAGAAGGCGFGLQLWGATLVSGARGVADAVGLDDLIAGADLVITGEGRFDDQSRYGKAVGVVSERAAAHGVGVALIAGEIAADVTGFVEAVALTSLGEASETLAHPAQFLEQAAAHVARVVRPHRS